MKLTPIDVPEELNDPNTWGAARVGALALVRGTVWEKQGNGGWVPYDCDAHVRSAIEKIPGAKLQHVLQDEYTIEVAPGTKVEDVLRSMELLLLCDDLDIDLESAARGEVKPRGK